MSQSLVADHDTKRHIVIIGGGIIGCTTAYYLTHHPSSPATVTVIEASAHGAAQGSSGKAGGLVAKWAYPEALAQLSFAEHAGLAAQHGGRERWGWRYVRCGSWEGRGAGERELVGGQPVGKAGLREAGVRKKRKLPADLAWMREDLTDAYAPMAQQGETAQVHPYLFTTSMLALATAAGAQFVFGTARLINTSEGEVTGVTYDPISGPEPTTTIPATHVILCAGAWSAALLPALPISGIRAHSVVLHPDSDASPPIPPHVLFAEVTAPSAPSSTPTSTSTVEIYPRPDNTLYACGATDDAPLPPSVDAVPVDVGACARIRQQLASISRAGLGAWTVGAQQACFLPVVTGAEGPVVGEARDVARGLIVAAGHTCWGICNAPGTAKAVCELVMEGRARCVDLAGLEPGGLL